MKNILKTIKDKIEARFPDAKKVVTKKVAVKKAKVVIKKGK